MLSWKERIERHPQRVPWIIVGMIVALVLSSLGIALIPLYRYALERESLQVNAAAQGLQSAISALLQRTETRVYSVSQNRPLARAAAKALKAGSAREFRRLMTEAAVLNAFDFAEFINLRGQVLFTTPDTSRYSLNQSRWHVVSETRTSAANATLTLVNNAVHAVASVPMFHEGRHIGTFVAGVTLGKSVVDEWATGLAADMAIHAERVDTVSTFPNGFVGAAHGHPNRSEILAIGGTRYAVRYLPLKTSRGTVIASALVGTSLERFIARLNNIILGGFVIVLPLLLLASVATLRLGRRLLALSARLSRALRTLEQKHERLRQSEEDLQTRARDALAVQETTQQLLRVSETDALVHLILQHARAMMPDLDIDLRWKDKSPPRHAAGLPLLWQRPMGRTGQGSPETREGDGTTGVMFCHGPRALQERESILLDTLWSSASLSLENILNFRDSVQRSKLAQEMAIAAEIQKSIMPGHFPAESGVFEVAGHYQAATLLAGDWMGCYHDSEQGLVRLYMGDVTGHGLSSCLISATVMSAVQVLESLAHGKIGGLDLLHTLQLLNEIVCRVGQQRHFMSLQIVEVDTRSGRGRMAQAAHPHPFLVTAIDRQEPRDAAGLVHRRQARRHVKTIAAAGSFLGFRSSPEAEFSVREFSMNPETSLILYTDGCIEMRDRSKRAYGLDRLQRLAVSHAGTTAPAMIESFLRDAKRFSGGHPPDDDATILVFRAEKNFARSSFNAAG